jgi:hypothetical protein
MMPALAPPSMMTGTGPLKASASAASIGSWIAARTTSGHGIRTLP